MSQSHPAVWVLECEGLHGVGRQPLNGINLAANRKKE